jgi:hypothetical protein
MASPARRELGSKGQDCQHRQVLDAVDYQTQQLQRGRIGPVEILEEKQHRPERGEVGEPREERIEGPFLPLLRRQVRRRAARVERNTKQTGEYRRDRGRIRGAGGEQGLQLREFRVGAVVSRKAGGMFEPNENRVQRAAGVMG